MPQLDIYTFPTQLYFIAVFFFFAFLFVIKFLLTAFFKIELLEKEEIYTSDTAVLIKMVQYNQRVNEGDQTQILSVITNSLVVPQSSRN